ncbi:TetR/AcrR family transcriptional regulator [Ruania alba]|uniref:DNA-binding transcriptional regulator, AcrR family n=1 Tax=Ruania alba TaxID=648782 RepID=A0A1H5CG87_9MICO|nr:TetR/AcrR family transcriptional regulator [Ruania alba]SED65676.1 DNA-binding transcriptional regulator, AcrR family [Ruania alba]
MPPPPAARAKVLHAFAEILVSQGERAATLDAVAERAGVSKGGLLYHFPTKEALVEGIAAYLGELVAADTEQMRADPEGPVAYLVRTSAHADSEFELIYGAVATLARGSHAGAAEALVRAQASWKETLAEGVPHPTLVRALVHMADGLAADAEVRRAAGHPPLAASEVEDLVTLAQEIADLRS